MHLLWFQSDMASLDKKLKKCGLTKKRMNKRQSDNVTSRAGHHLLPKTEPFIVIDHKIHPNSILITTTVSL